VYVRACGGEAQSVSDCPLESPTVEGEWSVVVRPLLSLKRRSHFKTRKTLGKKIMARSTALARTRGNLTDPSESLQTNVGLVPRFGSWSPSKSFPIHHSFILPFDTA
jgi:hypothetical protein